jgi:hypothetical protein
MVTAWWTADCRPRTLAQARADHVRELHLRGRVATGGNPPVAPTRSGLGDFHHPALPRGCLMSPSAYQRRFNFGRGRGSTRSICWKRGHVIFDR